MQLPDPMSNWWVKAVAFALFALLAGAIGHLFRTFENKEEFRWAILCIKALSAGLTGFLMFLLCMALNFNDIWAGIIVGVFGWLGAESTIAVLKGFVYTMLKVDTPKEKNSEPDSRSDSDKD